MYGHAIPEITPTQFAEAKGFRYQEQYNHFMDCHVIHHNLDRVLAGEEKLDVEAALAVLYIDKKLDRYCYDLISPAPHDHGTGAIQ
jgi:hypothetical protein